MAACAVLIYKLPLWDDPTSREAINSKVTMVFTVLALSPLFHAFNCRSERASIFRLGWLTNRFLVVAVLVSGAVHVLALVVPPLMPVFRSNHTWTTAELLWVIGLSALPIPIIELAKVVLAPLLAVKAPRARNVATSP
jgi:Ca2+-transporting ATPase